MLYKYNKFKISAPTWNEGPELLVDHILYQIFKIILNTSEKNIQKRLISFNKNIRK